MASDGEEEDLEQLRNAVLASMKNTRNRTGNDSEKNSDEEDSELLALRKAALLSKKPTAKNESNQCVSQRNESEHQSNNIIEVPVVQRTDERKVVRRLAQNNLIVINTMDDVAPKPPDQPARLLLPQEKWVGSSDEKSATSTPTRKSKFSRYESSSESDESSSSSDSSDEDEVTKNTSAAKLSRSFSDSDKDEKPDISQNSSTEKVNTSYTDKDKKNVTEVSQSHKIVTSSSLQHDMSSEGKSLSHSDGIISQSHFHQKTQSKEYSKEEISSDKKTNSNNVKNIQDSSSKTSVSAQSKPVLQEQTVKDSTVLEKLKPISAEKQPSKTELEKQNLPAKLPSANKSHSMSEALKSAEESKRTRPSSSSLTRKPKNQSPHRDRSPTSRSRPLSPSRSRPLSPSRSRQRSPVSRSKQQSPLSRSRNRSPAHRVKQQSPISRTRQRSPTRSSKRRSPLSKHDKKAKSPNQSEREHKPLRQRSPTRPSSVSKLGTSITRSRSPLQRTRSPETKRVPSLTRKSSPGRGSKTMPELSKYQDGNNRTKNGKVVRESNTSLYKRSSVSSAKNEEDRKKIERKEKFDKVAISKSVNKESISLRGTNSKSKSKARASSSSSESSSSESSSSSSSSSSGSAGKKKRLKKYKSYNDSKKRSVDKSRDLKQSLDRKKTESEQHRKKTESEQHRKKPPVRHQVSRSAAKASESSSSSSDSSSSSSMDSDSESEEETWRNKKQPKTERQKEDIERERKQRLQAERAKKAQMWKALQELKTKDVQNKDIKYSNRKEDSQKSRQTDNKKSLREEKSKSERSGKDTCTTFSKEKRPDSALDRDSKQDKDFWKDRHDKTKAWDDRTSVREWDRGKKIGKDWKDRDVSDSELDYKSGRWKSKWSEYSPREQEKFSPPRKRDYDWNRGDTDGYKKYDRNEFDRYDSGRGYKKNEDEDRRRQTKDSNRAGSSYKEECDRKQKSNKGDKAESINERLARIANVELDEKWTASGEKTQERYTKLQTLEEGEGDGKKQYDKHKNRNDSEFNKSKSSVSDRGRSGSRPDKDVYSKTSANLKESKETLKRKEDRKKRFEEFEDEDEDEIIPPKKLLTSVVTSKSKISTSDSKSRSPNTSASFHNEKESKIKDRNNDDGSHKSEVSNKRVVVTLDKDSSRDETVKLKDARQHITGKQQKSEGEEDTDKNSQKRTVQSLRKITFSNKPDVELNNSETKPQGERKSVHDRLGLPVDNHSKKKKKREIKIQSDDDLHFEQFKSSKDLSRETTGISKTIVNTEAEVSGVKRTAVKTTEEKEVIPAKKLATESKADKTKYDSELDARIKRIQQRNQEILRRQQEIQKDKETYG